ADVIAIRATRDADVIPCADLGIRHAIAHATGGDVMPSEAECADLAAAWSPYRSLAAQHLWASLRTVTTEETS
ncbi:MAG: 3-methyladenine DNA glycosylase/8-oxoguanine DNA glycosylase, partial [Candidatus Aldehydirespiratoraceae bacterium]